MQIGKIRRMSMFIVLIGAVATLFSAARAAGNPQWATLRGVLHYTYAYHPESGESVLYHLYTAPGRATQITSVVPLGADLNGKAVLVTGEPLPGDNGVAVFRAAQVALDPAVPAPSVPPPALGTVRYVNLLCKFQDIASEPQTPAYVTDLFGATYPRMGHYYPQVGYGTLNITASDTHGWFILPETKAYYLGYFLRLDQLFTDCVGAADSVVDFTQYDGVNTFYNSSNGTSWGGTAWLTLDGVTKVWRRTWMTHFEQGVMAHELGHSLGLPHSSGPYGEMYDSSWDVMSRIQCGDRNSAETTPFGGCAAQGTIGYHLSLLQALPASRILTVSPGQTVTTFLERLGLPINNNAKLLILVPIGSTNRFYTVEVRQRAGYDSALSTDSAVILHNVDATRKEPALVIDADNNGNPNDSGAIWTVGETFTDAAAGISVAVLESQPTGFVVRVTNNGVLGAPPAPSLISPVGVTAAQPLPVFMWNRTPRTDTYTLTVYNGPTSIYSTTLADSVACYGSICRHVYPLSALNVGTAYTWTVQAANSAGASPATTGNFTVASPLAAPILIGPTTKVESATTVTFTWNPVSGATAYRLQLYGVENNALNLSPTVHDQIYPAGTVCTTTCTATITTTLVNGGVYRWFLTPLNGAAVGPNATARFRVAAPPTDAPIALSPSGDSSINPPVMAWQPVIGATHYKVTLYRSDGYTYWWQYDSGSLCNGTICRFTLPNSQPQETHSWEVAGAAYTTNWVYGPTSARLYFTLVPPPALTAPIPYAPNGSTTSTLPTYRWSAVNEAQSYLLQVFQGAAQVVSKEYKAWEVCSGAVCLATPFSDALTFGQAYTWRVTPKTTVNGPASTTLGFTIRARRPDTIGVWRSTNTTFYLRNVNSVGAPDVVTTFGLSTDLPIVGDWDGDGVETVGVFRPSAGRFYLRNWNHNTAPIAYNFAFGLPGDVPVVGDWNADGKDEVGVWRPSARKFYLRDSLSSGPATYTITFGVTGDLPVAGDWNGDGKDSPGVWRPSNRVFYLTNTVCISCGAAPNYTFAFGLANDVPFVGDWNGDGVSGVGVFRPGSRMMYLRHTPTAGPVEISFRYGLSGDRPVGGRWQAGALDTAPSFVPKQ